MLVPLLFVASISHLQPADKTPAPLLIRVLSPDGSPAPSGIRVGIMIGFGKNNYATTAGPGLILDLPDGQPSPATDARGELLLPFAAIFGDGDAPRPQSVIAFEDARQLIGFGAADPARSGAVTVTLAPSCRVSIHIRSAELERLGLPIKRSVVYVHWNDLRPAIDSGDGPQRSLLLPPGDYSVQAYGTGMQSRRTALRVEPGKEELAVEIDLPATRLAHLQSHPAPELAGIKAWDGRPVTLESLRGKIVLLEFWGHWCGPCIHDMPLLVALYDRFKDRGLAVIAVHDDSVDSLDDYHAKILPIRDRLWNGKDLPFPVAIDGGGERPIPGEPAKARGTTTANYGITGFPTAVLIDRHGNVVGEFNYRTSDAAERLERIVGP